MTSPAKQESNARNAQKSRGPTSVAGKRRSSMNAITHGFTAKAVLLPDEDPGEFREMMVGMFDSFKPRDQYEVSLVERVACADWRLDRITRAQSARLCLNSQTLVAERKKREKRESNELVLRLLRAPHGRVTVLPFTDQPTENVEGGAEPRAFDTADHPSILVGRMCETEDGCTVLFHLWTELRTSLENGKKRLDAPERFRLFRLMCIHPIDAYINTAVASMLQACEVLDPEAGCLVGEVWNELVSAEGLTTIEKLYQAEIAHIPRPDEDAARAHLLGIVTGEMDWLAEKLQSYEERAELEAQLEVPCAAFDESREGELLRRYEVSTEKHYRSCRDELYRWRAEKKKRIESGDRGGYFRPSPRWFEEFNVRNHLFDTNEEAEVKSIRSMGDTGHSSEDGALLGEQRPGPSVGLDSGTVPPVRHLDDMEDRAAAAARSEQDDRNRVVECVETDGEFDDVAIGRSCEQATRGIQEAVATAGADNNDAQTADEGEESALGDREAVPPAIGTGTVETKGSNRERKRLKRLEWEKLKQEARRRAATLAGR
jgi:hypothetical protein